jgi:hypothetical protein
MSTPTTLNVPSSTASPGFEMASEPRGAMKRTLSQRVARAVKERAGQRPPYQHAAMMPARKMGKGTLEASGSRPCEMRLQAPKSTATLSTWGARAPRVAGRGRTRAS